MRYASVCDGIGAVHVAWRPLGWECAWTSEVEPFPAAVVDHHWKLKNLGDMTAITEEMLRNEGPISLLVGGTPCQSFSVAGLRRGLDDPRGNLALRFVQLVGVLRPTWVVWENVPGVLSSAGGRDFGTFLGALAELGYGFAYRVLDAQWFGVAQRRRRVFVVAHARDWRRAAAVLFEPESLFGNPPTRGEARQGTSVSPALRARANSSHREGSQAYVPDISPALKARDSKWPSSDGDGDGASLVPIAFKANMSTPAHGVGVSEKLQAENQTAVAMPYVKARRAQSSTDDETWTAGDVAPTQSCFDQGDVRATTVVAYDVHGTPASKAASETDVHTALRSRMPGQSENSMTTVCAVPIQYAEQLGREKRQNGMGLGSDGDPMFTLETRQPHGVAQGFTHSGYSNQPAWITGDRTDCLPASGHGDTSNQGIGVMTPIAFTTEQTPKFSSDRALTITKQSPTGGGQQQCVAYGCDDTAGTIRSNTRNNSDQRTEAAMHVMHGMAVRRLTPNECHRLQGFPDGYCAITYRGRPAADGPQYKALGNSMAVPVMRWIGQRIAEVDVTLPEAVSAEPSQEAAK